MITLGFLFTLTATEWWHCSLMSVLLHCAPCLQMYPNFTTFNIVFLSKMLSRERERVILSHLPWHILLPIPVKKPVVWCSWQTVWRSLFFRFLIKVCPHYLCFGSDVRSSTCLFIYVDGFMILNPSHIISQHPGLEWNTGSTRYAMWPIN